MLPDSAPSRLPVPHEWRRWAAECRLMGIAPAEIRRQLERKGFDADRELAELDAHPYLEAGDGMAQRLRKLESVLEALDRVGRTAEDSARLARRGPIATSEFLNDYYARNRPVVIEGLLEAWPARRLWTPAYLAARCGDCVVEVMDGREEGSHHEHYVKGRPRAMPLGEFVEMVQSASATNRFYLVGTNDLLQRQGAAPLWEDIGPLPDFLDARQRLKGSSLWFGPAGTITPLHHDTMNILFTQVVGRKQLVLIPPTQTHLVYNELNVFSEVDVERPDLERFPRFARATPLTVVVEPGEALFIPVGWWHHVRALDVSISVSFTNFTFPNSYRWVNPLIGQRG